VHLASSTSVWYAARAGGVVAYLLISASVLAGILLAGKKTVPGLPRFAVEDVHRFLGTLAGIFIAIHVGAVALDTVVPFSLTQLVVPFTAGYRPLATGIGIVALELLVAVSVTNRFRSRLPYRVWRRVHYATLAVWLLATVHGVLAGTDRDQTWLILLYALTVAAVAASAALRFGRAPEAQRLGIGLVAGGAALVLVLGLAVLPQHASHSKRTAVAVPELSGALRGTIADNGTGIVSIRGTADVKNAFRIDLLTGDGRVADNALQLRFASGTSCEGTVSSLDTRGFAGTCTLPGGGVRTVRGDWAVSNGNVSGTISTSTGAAAA
jgi:sulfoxide reductase heme-binding subunit YedZ